ncbi:hypothetical protein CAEBREN_18980 [Caenorhabditis brenneri]|uniref:Uncharacterized protein n=1 Tax=Caenorhabditis brenneri TaxID=135651 RepID=G0NP59_CAEBE|nr:hypothetical protein CAEBREN_18980 [Caenorhabditis brenneri]
MRTLEVFDLFENEKKHNYLNGIEADKSTIWYKENELILFLFYCFVIGTSLSFFKKVGNGPKNQRDILNPTKDFIPKLLGPAIQEGDSLVTYFSMISQIHIFSFLGSKESCTRLSNNVSIQSVFLEIERALATFFSEFLPVGSIL